MDFPIYHLGFFGDRSLIAVIGALHVIINHMLAVGGIPLVVALEWWGHRTGDPRWDLLARRIMFTFFVLATTIGALTGVGIWLSVALINPEAMGSLLRVFFWAWFTEWLVFVTEVVLILLYYLSWDRLSGSRKGRHLAIGVTLCVFSWITMALIVAILGFMMNPGDWLTDRTFLSAVFNDIYIPQLAFRTTLAMVMSGCGGLFLTWMFTAQGDEMRGKAIRFISVWMLGWGPLCLAALVWYWHRVPPEMIANLPVALGTQAYAASAETLKLVLFCLAGLIAVTAVVGMAAPRVLPRLALLLPVLAVVVLAGAFERSREFLRKPYIIYHYMYANRFRVEDYALLNHEGILPYSSYAKVTRVTPGNELVAGAEVFRLACSTCHTVNGVNGITAKLTTLYGAVPWNVDALTVNIEHLHDVHAYMPPFPGNEAEANALARWLVTLQPASTAPGAPGAPTAPTAPAKAQLELPAATDGALANRVSAAGMPPATAGR
jgi:mono/diheme cytochrome c family protein